MESAGKKELRARIRAELEAFSPEERERASSEICSKFKEVCSRSGLLKAVERIGLFRPVHFEVSLAALEKAIGAKKLFYPRVIGKEEFEWVHVPSPASKESWAVGAFGIEEPAGSTTEIAAPESLDLVIVPALAYSYSAHRLGRGGGYFDRMLKKSSEALKLGVCFDFQIVEKIPEEEWDIPVDWILTETQEIRTSQMESWLSRNSSKIKM